MNEAHATNLVIEIDLTQNFRKNLCSVMETVKHARRNLISVALMLMKNDPAMTAGEASRRVCGTNRLTRAIRYWSGKEVTGGAR